MAASDERKWTSEQDRILAEILAEREAQERSAQSSLTSVSQQEKTAKASGRTSVDEQIALAQAKAEATERVERAKAERKRLEAEIARERKEEQQEAKRMAQLEKRRAQSYDYAGRGVAYQTPSRAQNRYLIRGEGGPVWLDAAIVGGSAIATVAWTATRSPGQDVGWGFFLAGLGALTAVEGTGELARFGEGLLGGSAGYLTLRLMGKINNP